MVQPNLFLLGLPKCGTSSIANVLASHPAIFGSTPKETFFLVDRDSPFYKNDSYHAIGNGGWQRYFTSEKALAKFKYFLDATTHLAFQRSAPEVIRTYGNCRLIIVLRNPAERIYSSFNYTKFNLGFVDKNVTFSKYAEDLLNGNRTLDYVFNESSRFVLSKELEYSSYIDVLRPWQDFFKENKLYVAVFEEMKETPEIFYKNIFNWLQLPVPNIDYVSKNATYQPQNLSLHRIVFTMNRVFRKLPGIKKVKWIYFKYFTKKNLRTLDDKRAINALNDYFREKNKMLADLYNVNVSRWN